jgi:hypothetical protein
VSELLLMAFVVAIACGLVGAVAWLFVRGAERPDYVSNEWRTSHVRDRRDDA